MKSHGILMSGEMVKAYLAGRKTQTRRTRGLEDVNEEPDLWTFKKVGPLGWMAKKRYEGRFGAYFESEKIEPRTLSVCPVVAPYGGPGDQLWFKETWAHDDMDCKDPTCGNPDHIWYRANENKIVADSFSGSTHWRSSMFMPKWASRITVPITGVRVERLQDISEMDAMDEGLWNGYTSTGPAGYHRQKYFELWNKINGKKMPADKNPWVWVYEFPAYESLGECSFGYDLKG